MIGIPKAWGSSRSLISTGDNKSVFLENAYFVDYQFANKARTKDGIAEAGYKTSIDRSGMCLRLFTKKIGKMWVLHQASEALTLINFFIRSLFSCQSGSTKYLVHSVE